MQTRLACKVNVYKTKKCNLSAVNHVGPLLQLKFKISFFYHQVADLYIFGNLRTEENLNQIDETNSKSRSGQAPLVFDDHYQAILIR